MPGKRTTTTPFRVILLASGDLWGGAETVVYNLVKGLKEYRSIDLMAVLLNKGMLADLCVEEGVVTHIIDETKFNFPRLVIQLGRIASDFKPDIIHSHGYKENVLAFLTRSLFGIPKLVTTIHGFPEGHGKLKTRIASKLNFLALRFFFNKIVSVSGEMAQTLSQIYSISSHKIATIHNGIEIPKKTYRSNKEKENTVIGSAGRLFPVKDYPFMVDVAKQMCAKRDDVKFVLAGDGPEREKIATRIHESEICGRFKLLGHLDDMERFYSSIDIYLNTSRHEGLPMTVIEAMVHGLPVIAPNVGGMPEMIRNQKTGYLVEERSPKEFARVLDKTISQRNILDSMGRASRKVVQTRFSLGSMLHSYIKLYETLKVSRKRS